MVSYVLDTSVVSRLGTQLPVRRRVAEIGYRNCVLPAPVLLELGVTARTGAEHRTMMDRLHTAFAVVAATPWAQERALEVQGKLAERGLHRSARLGDLLIAAVAEQVGATILHYDRDFEVVAGVTGQPCEWVAPGGDLDPPRRETR